MPNLTPVLRPATVGRATALSPSVVHSLSGANTDRQSRHLARERRRYGDWDDFLEIPTAFLWLDMCAAAAALDPYQALECEAAVVTDLWP